MSSTQVIETDLQGLVVFRPTVRRDDRGFFVETYQRPDYAALGVDVEFVQDNHSRSTSGCLRGLHYQRRPGQAKLVSVARGAILDVAVDIRRGSPTFGRAAAFTLDDTDNLQLFVPVGFAHGFYVVSDVADVIYKVSAPYDPAEERGIAWNDPQLAIDWPVDSPILSARDRRNPRLSQIDLAELPVFVG
jgi:dTDP-4-dehydrorhamnose 3,5-epimerase